ncbi:hypothetical protein niasHT_011637 [Heterodera trifolii]|uniref:BTB domain-containing protein n=1 Tax=Heterodera trifolii TaxID=157864 RepID=A0ABD2LHA6_9BILA
MSKSPTDWMKLLLSTGEYADVHFLLGDGDEKELVPAHKLILRNSSDVFEAMFRFDTQNAKSDDASSNCPAVVEMPDVEPAAFKVMLSFIYAGDLSELNGDNAMAVLYAAKKYNIPALVDPSLQIPISKLHNVFLAYAQAHLFDLEDFANCCLSYIDKNADSLFKSDEFLQIDQKLLCEILERDELQIRGEISIWNANRRAILGSALFKIRFPLFSKEEFLKIVPSKVLTVEEKLGVYQFYCQSNFRGNYAPLFCPLKFPIHWRSWTFGTISMDIEKVSEFAREPMENYRLSDDTVYIKGLYWKILAQIKAKMQFNDNEKCLGIFLLCNDPTEDENWSCKYSATFRIVSKMDGVENSIGKLYDYIYNNKQPSRGFNFEFAELMEPNNGFYDKNGDKITVEIDFGVAEPKADKFISDSSKSYGTLFMEIEKVSEFAREIEQSERTSDTVHIKGFPWKIWAQKSQWTESIYNEKWLGIYLCCAAPQEDINWSCKCSVTFRIVSKMSGVADMKRDFSKEITFNSESVARGFSDFISFAELMDPEKGFYDKGEDKVTLAIDVTVKEAKTEDK